METIDKVMMHFGAILRYMAPGFVAVFVCVAVYPGCRPTCNMLASGHWVWVMAALAAISGLGIYALHRSAVVWFLWGSVTSQRSMV